jgi:hypothetical protein
LDPFPRGLQLAVHEDLGDGVQEESGGWDYTDSEQEEVDSEYITARPGDHLMTTFQCDLCHYRNITKRDPRPDSPEDRWLLTCIRRANLDAFWQLRPLTVHANLREMTTMSRCGEVLGLHEPLRDFPRGPFPLKDLQGMTFAAIMLQRSFDPGVNSTTIQWNTCRKLRSFLSGYIHTTPFGTGPATLTDGNSSTHFTASPTNSVWFKKFMAGFHNRLGDVIIQDQALTIDELLALQAVLERSWQSAKAVNDKELLFEIATLGMAVTGGFASALRGEELGHIRLNDTWTHSCQGLKHPRKPHCLLSLLGRFKGVIGRRKHQIPLAPTTASGIDVQLWLFRLIALFQDAGVTGGPLLRPTIMARLPARIKELDVIFHKYLLIVQEERPDIIATKINVPKMYSLRRSLRRGSTAQARNVGVPKDIILLNNRWRSVEKSRNKQSMPGEMIEYYTDVVVAIEALLKYSTPL